MEPARPDRGFVQFELYILAAVLLIVIAVVVPQARAHGWRGALVALLAIALVLAAVTGVLLGIGWLAEHGGHPGLRWVGHLLRFALCALLGAGLGAALLALHNVPVAVENAVTLAGAVLAGAAGLWLHIRLGPGRFWTAFGRLAFALFFSVLLGLFGILGPGNWGVDLGVLLPLAVFAGFAACGRVVPPPSPPEPDR